MAIDEEPKKVTIAALALGEHAGEPRVRVAGLLRNEGKSYVDDLRLVLADDEGRTISVTPWLPLEIVTPPAGSPAPWPHAMSEYLDKRVSLVGTWQGSEDGHVLRVLEGEIAAPPLGRLSREEIAGASAFGGAGLVGVGVLHGEVHVRDHRIVLVTSHLGSTSEVAFVTDLPERKARALEGKRVAVTGIVRKLSAWSGTITRAHIVRFPDRHVMPGEYVSLAGTVEHRPQSGPIGDAPPPGSWLVLREPLHVGRLETRDVYLENAWYPAGERVELFGRLAVLQDGGAEVAQHPHAALSGISSVTAGEPVYDGIQFRSAASSSPLTALVVERRDIVDGRNEIVVLDPARGVAHAGTMGGPHVHERSPFHGFFSSAPITAPTDAERAAVEFDGMGDAVLRESQELLRVLGREAPTNAPPSEALHTYWFDDHSFTLYEVVSGAEGQSPRIEWLVRVPHHALVGPNP